RPDPCQHEAGRLWDVLWLLALSLRCPEGALVRFGVHVRNDNREGTPPLVRLEALCGPGDAGEPVLTMLLPDEDGDTRPGPGAWRAGPSRAGPFIGGQTRDVDRARPGVGRVRAAGKRPQPAAFRAGCGATVSGRSAPAPQFFQAALALLLGTAL